ncbi:MAG: cadmium resistance transporter [Plectolyngbya sp. WJT66-NPBG17]|jgi:cadmium resistance transport/sequestration family protein|nr:cadmium resistance transporter [Plectolyngbya sp. WJT66-NPBG17]MBW4526979.1 cadmium resistance transporter [Phormidium tanganyikae FI6-MK23]
MLWFFSTVLTGAIAFAATNIDDLFVLMLFFSQVNASFKKSQIYWGQYLGFAGIVACSLLGFLGGLFIPQAWIGLLGFLPIVLGIRAFLNREEEDEIQGANLPNNAVIKLLMRFFHPKILSVAIVTFANGGDNIATYIPLFASLEMQRLLIVLAVFFSLIAVWCAIANWLANHPAIAPGLEQYNQILVPIVLIGLGIYILIENETWRVFV